MAEIAAPRSPVAPHSFTGSHSVTTFSAPTGADRPDPRRRDHETDDQEADASRRERLRSILPVALSVALLVGVVVTGGYVLRDLLDFGVWFLTQP